MFARIAVAFLLPVLVAAQAYGPAPGPSTPSTTSAAPVVVPSAPASTSTQMNINVGAGGNFVYSPANITAAVGTLVTFYFPATVPHSVTQSTFANPCTYLAADPTNSSAPVGFDSGLVTASTFTINITNTNPIWFHCRQLTHCGSGMVGSINAPLTGNNTYSAFQAAAVALGSSAPVETGTTTAVLGGLNGVATAPPASDTTTAGSSSSSGTTSDAAKVVASAGVAFVSAAFAMFVLA